MTTSNTFKSDPITLNAAEGDAVAWVLAEKKSL